MPRVWYCCHAICRDVGSGGGGRQGEDGWPSSVVLDILESPGFQRPFLHGIRRLMDQAINLPGQDPAFSVGIGIEKHRPAQAIMPVYDQR